MEPGMVIPWESGSLNFRLLALGLRWAMDTNFGPSHSSGLPLSGSPALYVHYGSTTSSSLD
ncbi:unnamed protein product [Dovyalis caffra]|uniref:Uncharacterized protein n=1 Tax=Dovyalis caffra TaxID=77055 RepID=A0AAV1QPD9_9ROSI|nr:unnamed protein product [Dovyalis caffra]